MSIPAWEGTMVPRSFAFRIAAALCLLSAQIVSASGQRASSMSPKQEEGKALLACAQMVVEQVQLAHIPADRAPRFQGKVPEAIALCRGGEQALLFRGTPWVDWANYWGTGDLTSLPQGFVSQKLPELRGVAGALLDLELQRVELIKFNLFDNAGTFSQYVQGREGVAGPALKVWPEMRLKPDSPWYQEVGGDGKQVCKDDLVRWRTVSGICNDVLNPAMGSAGMLFARNVEFGTSFPDQGLTDLTRNRHGNRLSLLEPDPQVISRRLLTRIQSDPDKCQAGYGLPGDSPAANCDYKKAPFFNVLAAFWIQFMTHDWFSHMEEGHNQAEFMKVGCESQLVNNVETPLTPDDVKRLGCRPDDRIDKGYVAEDSEPGTFAHDGKQYLARAPRTMSNNTTAWWDASQLYGYNDLSRKRVKRDAHDRAKLLLQPAGGSGPGYLPVFDDHDPINPEWKGQEAAGFPDNWTIGTSFYHNVFAREHNAFVDEFRKQAAQTPNADSGLRNPANPKQVIRYKDVTPDELFEVARLVVSAEIAKIHTTEWTPQLLYGEPLYKGMNANWSGLLGSGQPEVSKALNDIVVHNFGKSKDE